MDPKHRDRVAFVRVVSGKFTRDLTVTHSRTGKAFRLANAHKIFGRDREIIEEAYAGDVIGLVGYSDFGIGDTLSEDPKVVFDEIPRFAPECFARISNPNPSKYKPFAKGLEQLLREGVVRALVPRDMGDAKATLLAAVGPLQFEVAQFRLQSEYGVESRLEPMPWTLARWVGPGTKPGAVDAVALPMQSARVKDEEGNEMILFPTPWSLQYLSEKHPEIELLRGKGARPSLFKQGFKVFRSLWRDKLAHRGADHPFKRCLEHARKIGVGVHDSSVLAEGGGPFIHFFDEKSVGFLRALECENLITLIGMSNKRIHFTASDRAKCFLGLLEFGTESGVLALK
jgi:hypothetical protein